MATEETSDRRPVVDWFTDWDHLDPRWSQDPYPIWNDLRGKCPIASTERFYGAYLPTTYEAVKAIAYDTKNFSSRRVAIRDERIDHPDPLPPLSSDAPEHKSLKQLLLPYFTPPEVKELRPKAREICHDLIDKFIASGRCDVAQQFARQFPARIISHILGVSDADSDRFIQWIRDILEFGYFDQALADRGAAEMSAYFKEQIDLRRAAPTDDLITKVVQSTVDGKPLPDETIIGMINLLLIAGIDTTWSTLGASLWHLASTPADRARLVANPELLPTAVEEFLRAYSPANAAREVVGDTEIAGCPMKKGRMVLLSFPAANRDPALFPEPDRVILDRKDNRHVSFGLGVHRCIGSSLARMELEIGLAVWLERIPEFSLDEIKPVVWSRGPLRGPRHLPIRFD